jgi:hypothetical protein
MHNFSAFSSRDTEQFRLIASVRCSEISSPQIRHPISSVDPRSEASEDEPIHTLTFSNRQSGKSRYQKEAESEPVIYYTYGVPD